MAEWAIWTLVGTALAAFVAVAGVAVLAIVLTRSMTRPMRFGPRPPLDTTGLDVAPVRIRTDDGLDLVAQHVRVERPRATVIVLSGIHEPPAAAWTGHARLLHDHGYASLLLEMRAHGDSDGDRIGLGVLEVHDVAAAVRHLQDDEEAGDAPIALFGWSMGGAVALNAAARLPEVGAVIAAAAFSSWSDVVIDVARGTLGPAAGAMRPFLDLHLRHAYGPEARTAVPTRSVGLLGDRPLLLMHARHDPGVPIASLHRLAAAAPPHADVWIRDTADHELVRPDAFDRPWEDPPYAERIVAFLDAWTASDAGRGPSATSGVAPPGGRRDD